MLNETLQEQLEMVCSLDDQDKLSGKILEIENDVYHHDDCPGLSGTFLKKIRKSYAHAKLKTKSTPALEFGRMFHSFILEPEKFHQEYELGVKIPGKRKIFSQGLEESDASKTLVDPADWEQLHAMKSSIEENDSFMAMLKSGDMEQSFFWKEPKTGLMLKYRPDIYLPGLGIIIDLKTTQDASEEEFHREIPKRHYDLSAAMGIKVIEGVTGKKPEFVFAVIEKNAPYGFALYQADSAMIEMGDILLNDALEKYTHAVKPGAPKCYTSEIKPIGLPAYAFDKNSR